MDREVKPDAQQDSAPATMNPDAPPPEYAVAWVGLAHVEALAVVWGAA